MANRFRKVIISSIWLIQFLMRSVFLRLMIHDRVLRAKVISNSVHVTCKRLCNTMGLTINITNPEKLTILKSNTHLIVSNHISYTDILILASLAPITFVTSVEMKHNSILGFITRLSGCLYTERRSTAGLHDEIESVSNYLKDEINVGIFPEGTSYDGKWLRPFHKSLFQSAVISETPVLPICIKYTRINSSLIDVEEREKLAWINHEPFNLHLKRILSYSSISVDVTILDELTDYSKGRKELAETAQSAISLVYSDKSQDC